MTHKDILNDLDDYIDDALPAERRNLVEEHLRYCPECRRLEGELRELLDRATSLPKRLEPKRDLWPGIESRLETAPLSRLPSRHRRATIWYGGSALAVAATVILVFLSVYSLWRPQEITRLDIVESLGDSAVIPAFSMVEFESDKSEQDILSRIAQGGIILTNRVGNVLVENIEIVDSAIDDLRDALRADPTNMRLVRQLRSEYRQKMDLIQMLADIVSDEEPKIYTDFQPQRSAT